MVSRQIFARLNVNPLNQTFPKAERLASKKIIKELFDKGSSLYLYPFRLLYSFANDSAPMPQVLFTVPKRHFKKAVVRNRIKRRLREAYRLHKSSLFLHSEKKIPAYIGILYIAKEENSFEMIEKKLILALKRLS